MGIDIDMEWKDKTEEEQKEKELAIFRAGQESVEALLARRGNDPGVGRTALGHVGYLYEPYHGGPYAAVILLPEVTGPQVRVAKVPAAVMRSRLQEAMASCRQRAKTLYGDETGAWGDAMAKSFSDFVDLAERKEVETGEMVTITASL
jgi:hypothetical protein